MSAKQVPPTRFHFAYVGGVGSLLHRERITLATYGHHSSRLSNVPKLHLRVAIVSMLSEGGRRVLQTLAILQSLNLEIPHYY